MNFVTFGNVTINLDNVTHITVDTRKRDGGTAEVPFIRFNFVNSEGSIIFHMFDWDNKPVSAYHEAKDWLDGLQKSLTDAKEQAEVLEDSIPEEEEEECELSEEERERMWCEYHEAYHWPCF